MPQYTRRRLVATGIGFTAISALAGCTSNDADSGDSTGDGPGAQSSFFVFGDFATHVAGDAATAETLVPVGQHGHGWEPGPDIQGTILESDLFIYGTDGFQPWVGDLITSLRDDEADVEMVSVGEGVDLIEGGHDHGGEDEHDHEKEGETPWEHAGLYHLEAGSYSYTFGEGPDPEMSLAVLATDEGGDHGIEHVEETAKELYTSDHEAHTTVEGGDTLTPSQESLYVLEFTDSGETNFSLDIDTEGHYVLFSQHVPAEFDAALTDSGGAVVKPEASETAGGHDHESEDEHDHESEDEHDHESEDEHDHGAMDPHFWLDPQRAAQAVGKLEATFAEMDGENAEVYADNAAAYRDQLEELDGEIQSIVDDAPKETLFVAGHDAFQYLEDRYGLRVESLTDLSPDDQPTPRDIERAQDIIDEHGLAHVCADPLEDQTAAEQLVEETDATGMLPLTAIPGQTSEWADNDWGYIEIMENINLDTLETALNA
ncbi:Zinc ABC transporter, periplasmic-binding protein ZnuA [Halorubrum sp. DM2]|uniref:metal ABC transporter substrate-binding protein n=1 Tax=Halorubrum sp. DM2 TaxID=2527867 RepID=UPI0024B7EE37|nr:zinc ABC transporter substrate-binding protein [Halorubrum sp. DM2]VTT85153.1 Zinc ABC transporter, periplasmic-binding protein ZnuA [Halorubrum sp. DM2]